MTPLQRFVQYVIIANAVLNLFSFVNLKPDLAATLNQIPPFTAIPGQISLKSP
ncbi:hypothetical protein [Synechococcus sp. PCC 6312]|uniref:hypothetical protein n=1 Tax=Synechococcus sp. (strain ATCC 27167 / PCC 6312) TaxID=195253 RepID=UPI00029F4A80|nr:hypothetical protein [Synechococcus sp. PCC 6312]AFY61127.1 hypothetical protein Syn6312_1994 [Synechococcus sp. PCC 6312]